MLQAIVEAFDGEDNNEFWQFRDVRFDLESTFNYLPWEKVSSVTQNVEDMKGNPGERGVLVVSTMRLIWYMQNYKESNISVGYDAMTRAQKKVMFLPGSLTKYILHIKAVRGASRYEFQFSSTSEEAQHTYELVLKYYRIAFETVNYRKVQIRSSIASRSCELQPMPNEQIKSRYANVKYFIESSQLIGCLTITNIRIAWIGKDPTSNFSVPWICICEIGIKEKFDMDTLTIEAKDRFGTLDFVLYCKELQQLAIEAARLQETYRLKPFLGYEQIPLNNIGEEKIREFKEDIEIIQPTINVAKRPPRQTYQVGAANNTTDFQNISFCQELGLAIERLPEGTTVADMWQILRT